MGLPRRRKREDRREKRVVAGLLGRDGETSKGEQEENVPSREVARVGHDTRNRQADGPLDAYAEGVGEVDVRPRLW